MNILLIKSQHSLKSYQIGNIEKFSKEVFFQTNNFFFAKKNDQKIFLVHSVFYVLESKKKIQSDPKKKTFFKIFLTFLKAKNFKIFLDHSDFFLYFPIHKKLNGQKKIQNLWPLTLYSDPALAYCGSTIMQNFCSVKW